LSGAREQIQSKKPQEKTTARSAKTLAAKKSISGETATANGGALIRAEGLEALHSGCCLFCDHSGGIRCVAENIGLDRDDGRSYFVAATRVSFCCFER
jgi:hypothetical protein